MATRIVRTYEDDILRKKCKPVKAFDAKLHMLLDDMAETMYESNGVGLAAPQVGMLRRAVVIDIGDGILELINPEILETSGEQTGSEGCLSVPGKAGDVTRPNYVKVRAFDRDGNEYEVEGEELMARALCHEIDHLDGILYTDLCEEIYDVKPSEEESEDEAEAVEAEAAAENGE
ncbi:MAG: peptide deformylase [Firmicutes bacterium]|nr:peptide deformylase [Bacillota bacterium]